MKFYIVLSFIQTDCTCTHELFYAFQYLSSSKICGSKQLPPMAQLKFD